MNDVEVAAKELSVRVENAFEKLNIAELESKHAQLTKASQASDFWSNSEAAQTTMKQIAQLGSRLEPWQSLQKGLADIQELAKTGDEALSVELNQQLHVLTERFNELKGQLKLSGVHDARDAIVSIYAGAGGTDAQDWAQMLQRMYVRWAESNKFDAQQLEESSGEEAGIKSVTLMISGPFAYGKLKGEHGVHRLVRLSPFNADNLRQTSFAKVEVLPRIDEPDQIVIDEKDLKVDVYRSGGHGGQSVNTTDSAVRVTHVPTGIVVAIQNERSQLQNKETALTILRSKLAQLQIEQHKENLRELKGPNEQAAWGNQIRSYVLHPYKQVKDLRTRYETSDIDGVLDGGLNPFIESYLEHALGDATSAGT